MFTYKENQIVYFIGNEYTAPHLARIVHVFNSDNVIRLDTIGCQDMDTIRPFNTFEQICYEERLQSTHGVY